MEKVNRFLEIGSTVSQVRNLQTKLIIVTFGKGQLVPAGSESKYLNLGYILVHSQTRLASFTGQKQSPAAPLFLTLWYL